MSGGPGRDEPFGGGDKDTIGSQDGAVDNVVCGPDDFDSVVIHRSLDIV